MRRNVAQMFSCSGLPQRILCSKNSEKRKKAQQNALGVSVALFCCILIIARGAYICQGAERFFNLTDSFSISVKLRENCHCFEQYPIQSNTKKNSRHHLSRRAGSSFFLIFIALTESLTFVNGAFARLGQRDKHTRIIFFTPSYNSV